MQYHRNIIKIGASKGITIPQSILEAYQKRTGNTPKHVLVELEIVEI